MQIESQFFYDNVAYQALVNANGSAGAVVNAMGTTAPQRSRKGLKISNPDASNKLVVWVVPSTVAVGDVAGKPVFEYIGPADAKIIPVGAQLNVWMRSAAAAAINNVSVSEVF